MEYFELEDKPEKLKTSVWKKIIKLVLKKPKNIIFMIIFVSLVGLLDVFTPLLNTETLKIFFSENPDFSKRYLFITLYVLDALAYGITIYAFIKCAGNVEVEVGYELRKEAFAKLQALPFSYYDRTPSGWIMARLTSDSRKLSEIISWGMVDLFWGFVTMFGVLIMMFIKEWHLALIVLIVVPILFLICFFFTRSILKAYRNVRKTNSEITGYFNEGILGAKTTKTLCLEESREKEFEVLTSKMKKESLRAIIRGSLFWPCVLITGYVSVASSLSIGSAYTLNVLQGVTITIDILYLFTSYTILFFDPILAISRVVTDLQQAEASAERIVGLIETEVTITDSPDVVKKYGDIFNPKYENFPTLYGDVSFCDVSFEYNEKKKVLKDFNLFVPRGTSVALVGTTGAGKSTIINLLCRFYEPTSGKILLDGVDYKEYGLNFLHKSIGYVLQTPHLFNGTIKDNIAMGKPDATMEEIIDASKKANAYDFIMKLKDGFDTLVGEAGGKLSLGERQLISFARAIIIDPKILILDEATSSIDTQTETTIQRVMNQFMKGRTTFIVAHRLSTVINSDLILVIEDGKIKEQGNHKELLKLKGHYYKLYKNQFMSEQIDKTSESLVSNN